jgi:hypothetical protein
MDPQPLEVEKRYIKLKQKEKKYLRISKKSSTFAEIFENNTKLYQYGIQVCTHVSIG